MAPWNSWRGFYAEIGPQTRKYFNGNLAYAFEHESDSEKNMMVIIDDTDDDDYILCFHCEFLLLAS